MADKVDYLLQDSGALVLTVDKNREAMNAKGFKEAGYTALTDARQNLAAKETAQQNSNSLAVKKTAEQNEAVKNIKQLIQKIKDAAKSAYGKDPVMLRPFKVGEAIPTTVQKLVTTCSYLSSLLLEHRDVLLENGLNEEDINGMHNAGGSLTALDAIQENSKKMKAAATLVRNQAANNLKDRMFRVRNFAKSCFAGNQEILLQFKPISKGRGSSAPTDGDNPAETGPAQAG